MTATTTATLMVSPSSGGPFGTPVWRVGVYSQMVESSGAPYWLVRDPDSHRDEYVPIPVMDDFTVAQSVLLMLAMTIGSEHCKDIVREHHNLVLNENQLRAAECWDLSDEEQSLITREFSNRVRLGITNLDEFSCVTPGAMALLRSWGFQVDYFS